MELALKNGQKVAPNRDQDWSETTRRESGDLEITWAPCFGWAAESTDVRDRTKGGKSEDAFLLFEMTLAKKGQAILKFALSEVSNFQLEDKCAEGKFALRQKKVPRQNMCLK
jgi:hypothetical protein